MGCCCKRKGDVRKCVPFYIIGGVLCILGLPLMIVGIVADFTEADLVGYIGGLSIFFGLGFFLIWHMFTIENIDKNLDLDYDPNVKDIRDVVEKSRLRESTSLSIISLNNSKSGFTNHAFEQEKGTAFKSDNSTIKTSETTSPLDEPPINRDATVNLGNKLHKIDSNSSSYSDKTEENSSGSILSVSKIDIPSEMSSTRSSYNGTTSTNIMHENNIDIKSDGGKKESLPVEIA